MLLGSSVIGRHALAQLPSSATIALPASLGTFNETGISARFSLSVPAPVTTYAVTGNADAFSLKFATLTQAYSVSGVATLFRFNMPSAQTTYLVTGNAAFLGAGGFGANTGFFAVSGLPANFLVTSSGGIAAPGSFTVMGNAATFGLNREAWFPRPFDSDSWTAEATPAETWTPSLKQVEIWTIS